jgi:hypothetical protein
MNEWIAGSYRLAGGVLINTSCGGNPVVLPSRSLPGLRRRTLATVLVGFLVAVPAVPAQMRWTVDPKTSLAWWQMSPHLNHLWGTTCPAEPSWLPGEGRSAGWGSMSTATKTREAAVEDTVNVPLHPRLRVRPVCTEAVRGEVVVLDTVHWRGVRGAVAVRGDALITGLDLRDVLMHRTLETTRFPEIRFTLDSLVDVTRQADTVRGTAVGVLLLRGHEKPCRAPFKAWPEAGGTRVLAKFRVTAPSLVLEFGMSRMALDLGVGTDIWKTLFMGVDLVVRPEAL